MSGSYCQMGMKSLVALVSLLTSLWVRAVLAQTPVTILTGRVLDAKTGQPLPFATVYLNNSSLGTNADQNGVYRLSNVPLGNQELVASMLSYRTLRQPLRLTDTRPRALNLSLEPADQDLATVTVSARHNPTWVRQFRIFSRELLGSQPQARQCRILNPNVLSFKEEKGHLLAQATEPILIENGALGYQLAYNLLHFDYFRGRMQFAGTTRFDELKVTSARQQAQWQASRLKVYQGSLQHLLASLMAGTHEQAGYVVYRTPLVGDSNTQDLPLVRMTDRQYLGSAQVQSLFRPGELPFERRLVSDQPLEVYYNRVYAANSPYRDLPYAYSLLLLPKGSLELTTNGWITQGNGLDVRGYLGKERLATLLPADWAPIDSELLLANSITAGRSGRPDAVLDSLVTLRRRQYERTPPIVYLHTDKALYATGDQLWLSAYVLDAARQLPVVGRPGATLSVDVVAPTGQIVQHQWIQLTGGRAAAHFRLADTLSSGTYRLRARTAMDPLAGSPAFESTFAVYQLSQRSTLSPGGQPGMGVARKPPAQSPLSDSLDVQFLPEGGRWLVGVAGRLGIKALASDGRGYAVGGRIVDGTGNEITRFKTNALGMGQVALTPKAGGRYRALIERSSTGTVQSVNIPNAETEGWALSVDAVSDSSRLTVSVWATGRNSQQPVYVTLQSREQLVYRQKWLLTKGEAHFSLSTATLPPGVCRVTVWDTTRRPRAERLIFVAERGERIQMRVTMGKPRYQAREPMALGFQFRDAEGYSVVGNWSAAVTDADQLPADTTQADLRTYLLLTGGLRGRIEAPAYYLEPEHARDLDAMLLTQGWRRLPASSVADSIGGWTLRGHVRDQQGKALAGKAVLLWLGKGEQLQIRSATTDAQGLFSVPNLFLADSVPVQVRVFSTSPTGAVITFATPADDLSTSLAGPTDPSGLADWLAAARRRQAAWPALYRDSTARQLAEVTVRAKKLAAERPLDVERSSLHSGADAVILVDENAPPVKDIFALMIGRLPGVQIIPGMGGYRVIIRGPSSLGSSAPLYLLDGVYVDQGTLLTVDPNAVARIELLKNPDTAGIYGARAAGGVIAVYTRKRNEAPLTKPAGKETIIFGFVTPREFYVPGYESLPTQAPEDRRDVLFWQPLGQSDADGLGHLTFPLSDVVKRIRVVVQGLTTEGVPLSFSWELPVR